MHRALKRAYRAQKRAHFGGTNRGKQGQAGTMPCLSECAGRAYFIGNFAMLPGIPAAWVWLGPLILLSFLQIYLDL
jgi:hypothetical protein